MKKIKTITQIFLVSVVLLAPVSSFAMMSDKSCYDRCNDAYPDDDALFGACMNGCDFANY